MRFDKARNPFRPGYGELPPELAGRDTIKSEFELQIRRLKLKERRTTTLALIGPRGCGKTALLYWLRMHAVAASIQVDELEPDDLSSVAALAGALTRPVRRLSGRVKAEDRFPTEAGDAGASADLGGSVNGSGQSSIFQLLVAKAKRKPLILIVDEAHELKLEVAHTLFRSFQTAASRQPMLLAFAGTPDTRIHLRNARDTFVEREKEFLVGLLDEGTSMQALAKPLEALGVGYDEAVLLRAASEAQHYPYFLQCWGEALWNALPEKKPFSGGESGWGWFSSLLPFKPRLGRTEFKAAKESASERSRWLFGDRLAELRSYGIISPAAELALSLNEGGGSNIALRNFSTNLAVRWQMSGMPPPRGLSQDNLTESATQLLLHTGFVWEPEPGRYEFGIRSLAEHTVNSAAKDIAAQMAVQDGVPAFRAVFEFAGRTERTHDEVVDHLVRNGTVEDSGHANRILRPLEEDGVLGPVGRKNANGSHLLLVLTPRLAEAAVEQMRRMQRPQPCANPDEGPTPQ